MQITESIISIIVLALLIAVGVMIIGNMESATVGDCTTNYTTVEQATTVHGNGTHNLSVENQLTTYQANLTVTYTGSDGNVSVNTHFLGNLDGTSPDNFLFSASLLNASTQITYAGIANEETNITKANLSYWSLKDCTYNYNAYKAIDKQNKTIWSAMGILPIVVIVLAAVAVIGAVMAMRRT